MKNSKLFSVFEALSPKDRKELGNWVISPAINRRQHVSRLFDYLTSVEKDNLKEINWKEAFQTAYPKEEYDIAKIRNSASFLLKIIETYLVKKELADNSELQGLALAAAYRKLKLSNRYEKSLEKTRQVLSKKKIKNAEHFSTSYFLELEQYKFYSAERSLSKLNLQAVSDNLDIAYTAHKLRVMCLSLSHQAVSAKEYDFGLFNHLIEKIDEEQYMKISAIAVYYHYYKALTHSDEERNFLLFKKLLIEESEKFPHAEIRDLYLLATNYCIKRTNETNKKYAEEGLNLYLEGLNKGIFLVKGELSRITYFNAISMALILEKYDFAKTFAEKYRTALPSKIRESSYYFNLARLEYQRGNFEDALPLLQKIKFRSSVFQLTVKTMTAKILYETSETDVLLFHLNAMLQFIRRKKVLGYHRENFQNFILTLKKIVSLPAFEKSGKLLIKKEIEQAKAIAERTWLLDQL